MITADERARIRSLVMDEHRPIREVARMLEVSKNTVKRCIRAPEGAMPKCSLKSANGKYLAEHKDDIRKLYEQCELRCPPLRRLLKERLDIDVTLRMLERFCSEFNKEHKILRLQQDIPVRYETAPGQHMQIDFGEKDVLVKGEKVRLHLFVAKLGYSRRIFAKAYYAETQAAWFDGVQSAFRYFGGLPYVIVCDNASSLVRDHYAKEAAARYTEGFYQLCQYYNVKPLATSVRKPRSKGKVENAVNYVKNNLPGVDQPDLTSWNLWLEKWCMESDERRLTTIFEGALTPRQRWIVEKTKMRRNDKPPMMRTFIESRKVGRDGLVRVENKHYRVPDSLVGLEVQLQIDEKSITVMKGTQVVATLNKTADVFNPQPQITSSGDPRTEAFEKKRKELEKDKLWSEFNRNIKDKNNSANLKDYDDTVGWSKQESAK